MVGVADEIVSPELVLVSPPDVAAQAREALPDYELEWELLVARLRAEAAAAVESEPPARLTFGAAVFTLAAAVTSAAPLVLPILFR